MSDEAMTDETKHPQAAELPELDALKVHKLEPPKERKHLPLLGVPVPPPNDVTEVCFEPETKPDGPVDPEAVRASIVESLKTVFDPEIPVNIYELGLVYGIDVDDAGVVEVRMTLTAPGCPVAGSLVAEVARKVGEVPGVTRSDVKLVWDPPWTKERMSEEALLELGLL